VLFILYFVWSCKEVTYIVQLFMCCYCYAVEIRHLVDFVLTFLLYLHFRDEVK